MQNVEEGEKTSKLEECVGTTPVKTSNRSEEDNLSSPMIYKVLYLCKCEELEDMSEYKLNEIQVSEEERQQMQEQIKMHQEEISAMRSEVELLKEEMSQKEGETARALREKSDTESRVAGIEMQFQTYRSKMTIREKELLSLIDSTNADSLDAMKKSLEKCKTENEELQGEIRRERLTRDEEIAKSERIIADLREEMNQSEKARHESEMNLRNKINDLEGEKNHDKIAQLQSEVDSMREVITMLEQSISSLESENKELSMRILECTTVCDDSNVTLNASSFSDITHCPEDMSLVEMDQTLVCNLIGKSNSYSAPKTKSLVESLQSDIKHLTEENEKLSSQLFESIEDADCHQRKCIEMQKRIDELQSTPDQLKDTEASVKVLQMEKDKLTEERAAAREEWSQQKKELEMMITFYSDKAARCESKIMELNTQISDLVLEKEEMKVKIERSQVELSNKIDLQSEYEELSKDYQVLRKQNAGSSSIISDLQEKNNDLKIQVDALMYEVESLREKSSSDYEVMLEKDKRIQQLTRTIESKKNQLKLLENNNAQSKMEMDKVAIEEMEKSHQEKLAQLTKAHEEEIEKLSKEKEKVEHERLQVMSLIELVKKESKEKMDFYESKLMKCQASIMKNNQIIDDLMRENFTLKTSVTKSRDSTKKLNDLHKQIAEYRDKLTQLAQDKGYLTRTLDEVAKECVELQRAKQTLQEELDGVRRASEAILSQKTNDLNASIVQLREKVHESESQAAKLTNRIEELEKKEREAMKTIEDMHKSHECQVKELKGIISDEEEKQRQLQTEKDKLYGVNEDLKTVINELKSVLEELKEEITRSEKELQQARESNEKFQRIIDETHAKYREEIKNIKTEKITSEESTLTAQIDQLKEILAKKNGAYEQLSANYHSAQQRFNEVERENESNRSEVESLRERIAHMTDLSAEGEKERAKLDLELQQKTSLINKLNERLNKLTLTNPEEMQEELQRIKSQNESVQAEIEVVKKLAKEKGLEVDVLQKESHDKCQIIESLENDKDEMVKEYRSLKLRLEKKIKSLKEANNFVVEERDYLKKTFSAIEDKDKEIELLKERVARKEKSIDKLNNLLKEKMIEINDLRVKKGDRVKDSSPTSRIDIQERRKSDRQSLHDGNRSIVFALERDVATMTDPTSESSLITHLQREVEVLKYKLSDSSRSLEVNSLKNDLQMMKLDLNKKDLMIHNLTQDVVRLEKQLSRSEMEIKSRLREKRSTPIASNHAVCQTDEVSARSSDSELIMRDLEEANREVKRLQEKCVMFQCEAMRMNERIQQLEGPMHQKENDAANCNTVGGEMEVLREKYNNLKRLFFAMRTKYEGH